MHHFQSIVVMIWATLCLGACSGKPKAPEAPKREAETIGFGAAVRSVAVTPDGSYLLAGGSDKKLYLVDVDSAKVRWQSTLMPEGILSVAIAPNGQSFVSTCGDNTDRTGQIVLHDYASKSEVWAVRHAANDMQAAIFSPDGAVVAVANYFDILIYDATTGKRVRKLSGHPVDVPARSGHVEAVTDLVFSKNGQKLYSVGWDRNLKIWDLTNGKEIKTLPVADPINTCILMNDGQRVITGSAGAIHVWNVESGLPDTILTVPGDVLALTLIGSGRHYASGDNQGNIHIRDSGNHGIVQTLLNAHPRGVWSLNSTPDGATLVSAGEDGRVTIWPIDQMLTEKQEPSL